MSHRVRDEVLLRQSISYLISIYGIDDHSYSTRTKKRTQDVKTKTMIIAWANVRSVGYNHPARCVNEWLSKTSDDGGQHWLSSFYVFFISTVSRENWSPSLFWHSSFDESMISPFDFSPPFLCLFLSSSTRVTL